MLLQIGMGVITAHYAVEGQSFFGIPLAEVLPYVVSRTVHTQVGIFWIATAWLATGLYIAPLLSGREPKLQKLGVDVLFWALIVVVRRLDRHRLARHAAAPRRRLQLLARQPGPRVHQHGPRLADAAVRRPAVLGLPARPRAVAGAEEAVGDARPDRDGVPVGHLHRRLLRHLARPGASTPTTR